MSPRWFSLLLGLGLALSGTAAGPAEAAGKPATINLRPRLYQDYVVATARPRSDAEVAQLWQQAEHVMAPHDQSLTTHTLVVTRATATSLRQAGLDVTVEAQNVQQMVDESYARNDLVVAAAGPFGEFFAKVQPLEVIEAYLKELVSKSEGRAKLVTIGRSVQGRDIVALLISARPDDASRASIIATGTHHAREWLSPMVTMGIADGLINRADDPKVRAVVDNLNVYVVPVVNPDGYVRTFNGNRLQRKNMRVGCNVDVNRNYPTAFGQRVASACTAETTPGPMAFSEPETRAIKELAEKQTKLRFYVDYHSSGNQVMIPYAFTRDEPPGLEKNRTWGNLLAAEAKLPARPAYNLAQGQGGGALDWFREKYTESLVVELPGRGFDPPANGVAANVELQWTGWLAVAEIVARENPAEGAPPPPAGDAGVVEGDAGAGGAGGTGSAGAAGAADGPGSGGTGGPVGTGGAAGSGGRAAAAGGTGGSGESGPADAAGLTGNGGPIPSDASELSGLGCQIGGGRPSWLLAALGAVVVGLARRRRRA